MMWSVKLTCASCVLFLSVCVSYADHLGCRKKHYYNNSLLNGPAHKVCAYKSSGQIFSSQDCLLTEYSTYETDKMCSNLVFSKAYSDRLTTVMLLPYVDVYSNFNITFTKNNWKYMRYRLQFRDVQEKSLCMEILFEDTTNVIEGTALSFACRMFGNRHEGRETELYFSVGESSSQLLGGGHYLMRVPQLSKIDSSKEVSIEKWELLVILDVTHLPNLTILWPVAPSHFNVSDYELKVLSAERDDDQIWRTVETFKVSAAACDEGVCKETVPFGYGTYQVKATVQMITDECKPDLCITESMSLKIVSTYPLYLWLLILLLPIVFVATLLRLAYYYCCRRTQEIPVLLLYNRTERTHCHAVGEMVEYLQNVGGFQCLHYKDPVDGSEDGDKALCEWWEAAFAKAKAVIVVASPPRCGNIEYFRNSQVARIGFTELKNWLGDSEKRFLVALPPYCKVHNVPLEAQNLPRFFLPQDFDALFWYIHCPFRWATRCISLVKVFFSCSCLSKYASDYKKHGCKMEKAWISAGAVCILEGTDEEMPFNNDSSSEIPDVTSSVIWPCLKDLNLAPSTVSGGLSTVRVQEEDEQDISLEYPVKSLSQLQL